MSAEIFNLRGARKRKSRAQKERAAADNRVRYGLTRAERRLAEAEREKQTRALDGAKILRPQDEM